MTIDQQDLDLIWATFPKGVEYIITKESDTAVRCKAVYNGGFSDDLDKDKAWDKFTADIERLFHNRVAEFYHHTCTRHQDFVIYFRKSPKITENA